VRHSFAWFALLLLVAPLGSARAAGEDDPFRDDGSIRYRFYTGGELLYLRRSGGDDVPITQNIRCCTLPLVTEELTSNDAVNGDWKFGGRGYFGARLDAVSSVEVTYLGIGYSGDETAAAPAFETLNAFELPDAMTFPDGSFDDAAYHQIKYDAMLHSGELSYRRRLEVDGVDYHFNLLAGLRALRFEEDLGLDSWDSDTDPLPASEFGHYDVSARNTLIGAQVGADAFVPLWAERLDLDIYFAVGGYANEANVYSSYVDGNTGTNIRQSDNEWKASGVLEAAAQLQFRLWRGVRMNLGYRAVYLINVASGPGNFAESGGNDDFFDSYDAGSEVLFHGASVGFGVDF